jgi:hypothetical protein
MESEDSLLYTVLTHLSSVHALTPIFKIYFNITFQSVPKSSFQIFQTKFCLHFSYS